MNLHILLRYTMSRGCTGTFYTRITIICA